MVYSYAIHFVIEFISEGIGGSRETPAYCFFILNSEKTTDGFERSNNALVGGCNTSMQKCGAPFCK